MANKARGTVSIDLPNGAYDLVLSLETLCQLEDKFKVDTFEEAFARVGQKAKANRDFFECIFSGSGYELTEEVKRDIGSMTVPIAAQLLSDLMIAGGMKSDAPEETAGPLEPTNPEPSAGESG